MALETLENVKVVMNRRYVRCVCIRSSNTLVLRAIALVIAALCFSSVSVSSNENPVSVEVYEKNDRFFVRANDADIAEIFASLADKSGVPILLLPKPYNSNKITVSVENSTLTDVIKHVLEKLAISGYVITLTPNRRNGYGQMLEVRLLTATAKTHQGAFPHKDPPASTQRLIDQLITINEDLPQHNQESSRPFDKHEKKVREHLSDDIEKLEALGYSVPEVIRDFSHTEAQTGEKSTKQVKGSFLPALEHESDMQERLVEDMIELEAEGYSVPELPPRPAMVSENGY